jgi:hypothetical protein
MKVYNTLSDIAFQCPLSGGEGVFKARALYSFVIGDTLYDDSTMCATQGLSWRKGNPPLSVQHVSMNIHPNPATQTVEISMSEDLPIGTPIVLTNQLGVEVKRIQVEKEAKHFTLSVADLPQGVYYISTFISDHLVAAKLIVIH